MRNPPFVVFALPRSRTAWLSRFLSYQNWHCGHEEVRHCRSFDDVKSWLDQMCIGTVETAAAPFWRLLPPETRIVTVRRPPADVMLSLSAPGFAVDPLVMLPVLRRADAKLDQIEARLPGVLSVRYADLATEATCAAVFEHCLPYRHDPRWWAKCDAVNVQINVEPILRYFAAYQPQIAAACAEAKARTIAKLRGLPYAGSSSAIVPIVRRADYTIRMELIDGAMFGHLEVRRWSPRVLRELKRDTDTLLELHGGPIFSTADKPHAGDFAKFRKLQAVLGFEFLTAIHSAKQPIFVRWR